MGRNGLAQGGGKRVCSHPSPETEHTLHSMRCIAIANQKGGVGKTTTAVNLAAALAAAGKRALLIDLDPQANATTGMGLAKTLNPNVYHVLLEEVGVMSAVRRAAQLDLLPASPDLAGAEVELVQRPQRESVLRRALEKAPDQWDYCLIDCPPALNLLTINALVAAERVLIPMQCEYYALEGLAQLLATIRRVRAQLNPKLELHGVLRTMFDTRNRLAGEVGSELERHFPEKLYRTVVPRNVRLAEAPSYGKAVFDYDPHCAGAEAYRVLAAEFLQREWRP